jgi:hypothetical protein
MLCLNLYFFQKSISFSTFSPIFKDNKDSNLSYWETISEKDLG